MPDQPYFGFSKLTTLLIENKLSSRESYTVIEKGMLKGLKFILEESDSHLNNI